MHEFGGFNYQVIFQKRKDKKEQTIKRESDVKVSHARCLVIRGHSI